MEKNIHLIVKRICNKNIHNINYFHNEDYNDFYKEFEYNGLFIINVSYVYNKILIFFNKYKFLFIIFLIIFLYFKYT